MVMTGETPRGFSLLRRPTSLFGRRAFPVPLAGFSRNLLTANAEFTAAGGFGRQIPCRQGNRASGVPPLPSLHVAEAASGHAVAIGRPDGQPSNLRCSAACVRIECNSRVSGVGAQFV